MALVWSLAILSTIGSIHIGNVCAQPPARPVSGPSCQLPPFHIDGYVLSLQWPIAFCVKQGACSLDRPRHEWTIHGLWPQFNRTKSKIAKQLTGSPYPQYCCHPQDEVDFAQLNDRLGEQMLRLWPSLKAPGRGSPLSQMFSFWRHEWTKHGTCALRSLDPDHSSVLRPMPFSMEQYLDTTLQLHKRFALNRWLTAAGIRPDNFRTYPRKSVHQALETHSNPISTIDEDYKSKGHTDKEQDQLEGVFRLLCDRTATKQRSAPGILSEVQICLSTHLTPINCAHLFASQDDDQSPLDVIGSGSVDDHECGQHVVLLQY